VGVAVDDHVQVTEPDASQAADLFPNHSRPIPAPAPRTSAALRLSQPNTPRLTTVMIDDPRER
jgi:hypothetical protein